MFTQRHEVAQWLQEKNIDYYIIHSDLRVDVKGQVDLKNMNLTHIPIQFGEVSARFDCSNNQLTHLKGVPQKVYSFECENNFITDYQNGPKWVEHFYCSGKIDLRQLMDLNLENQFYHTCSLDEQIQFFSPLYQFQSHNQTYTLQINSEQFNEVINMIKEKKILDNSIDLPYPSVNKIKI